MSLHRHSHNRSSRGIAIALIIAIGACCFSCANMGRPGGGPKDETPPVLKKSNPPMGALHYDKNKITLEFDEIVQVENPNEKIIISPPQTQMPQISALGRIVSITLNDSMKANTTYTIDCGDAIADNNEKNKLLNFSFHFSTGDHIDTLEMSGILLNAADLEPVSDMLVGIYMQPTFKGIAPVAAGTLLSWNGEGWKARVAHQSSASNSKSGFVYWTHELDVGANDVVVTTIGLAYSEEALDYTTSVVRASDNTTTNATEHVFLINNRRVSGFLAGIYLPGTAECSQISTSAMASIVIEKYEPLHEDTSNSSRWVLYPTTDKPFETLNKCRSLFLADDLNETSFNITARLRYTSPPAP